MEENDDDQPPAPPNHSSFNSKKTFYSPKKHYTNYSFSHSPKFPLFWTFDNLGKYGYDFKIIDVVIVYHVNLFGAA